ncbi:MAG: DUF4097 domain-containing protein [Oscillospiraceae bacterium]|nr:DUF4097 domain-containing protein [Oscillospiraceae bacterium]
MSEFLKNMSGFFGKVKMKKSAIILAVTFVISTTLFFLSVILTTGFDRNSYFAVVLNSHYRAEDVYREFEESFSNISIEISSGKATIKPSADAVTRVTYTAAGIPANIETEVKNDTLYVKEKWVLTLMIWTLFDDSELVIEIPEKDYNDISLSVSSGSLNTQGLVVETSTLRTRISSGIMDINGISCTEYSTKCSSGSMTLSGVSGKGDVQVSSGKVTVNYAEWNDSLNAKVSSGSLTFNVPEDAGVNMDCKVTSGSARYDLNGNSGSFGTVRGAKFGGENVQDVTVRVSSGKIAINN